MAFILRPRRVATVCMGSSSRLMRLDSTRTRNRHTGRTLFIGACLKPPNGKPGAIGKAGRLSGSCEAIWSCWRASDAVRPRLTELPGLYDNPALLIRGQRASFAPPALPAACRLRIGLLDCLIKFTRHFTAAFDVLLVQLRADTAVRPDWTW